MKNILSLAALLLTGTSLAASGADVYKSTCAACHQATGKGMPGTFPPLAGKSIPVLLATPAGRTFLANAVLYGLQGSLTVDGKTYNGVMPAQKQLSDADLAAVLNHVATSWGNKWPAGQKPYTAAEITKLRAKTMTPDAVLKSRPPIK